MNLFSMSDIPSHQRVDLQQTIPPSQDLNLSGATETFDPLNTCCRYHPQKCVAFAVCQLLCPSCKHRKFGKQEVFWHTSTSISVHFQNTKFLNEAKCPLQRGCPHYLWPALTGLMAMFLYKNSGILINSTLTDQGGVRINLKLPFN